MKTSVLDIISKLTERNYKRLEAIHNELGDIRNEAGMLKTICENQIKPKHRSKTKDNKQA